MVLTLFMLAMGLYCTTYTKFFPRSCWSIMLTVEGTDSCASVLVFFFPHVITLYVTSVITLCTDVYNNIVAFVIAVLFRKSTEGSFRAIGFFPRFERLETFQGAKGAPFLVGQPDNQSSFWMLEEYSSIKYFNLQHHGTSSIYCSLMMIRVFQFFFKGTFLGIFQPSYQRDLHRLHPVFN